MHLSFDEHRLEASSSQSISPGDHPAVDLLYSTGTLSAATVVEVQWGSALLLSASLAVRRGAWVLITAASGQYIVQARLFFSIEGVVFINGPCILLTDANSDPLHSAWTLSTAALQTSPTASIPLPQITSLSRLHTYRVKQDTTHFIKML